MLLKKKIKLNSDYISLISSDINIFVFTIQAIAKKSNKTRIIKITTQLNLKEISCLTTEQNLVFYIHKSLDKSLSWDINDQDHRIRVYGTNNLSLRTPTKANKTAKNTLNNPKAPHITKQPKIICDNDLPKNQDHYSCTEIQKLTNHFESKIASLEQQIQYFQETLSLLEKKNSATQAEKHDFMDPHIQQHQSLQQQMKNLENVLLRIENKNSFGHVPTHKNTYQRNWKKKGFVPIRVFLSHTKIQQIHTQEPNKTTRTYLFQSKIKKQLRNVEITTQKEINTNVQISFYIHNESINSSNWTLNDQQNQIIFYEMDKKYKYIKPV